jgi:hypothetical protein
MIVGVVEVIALQNLWQLKQDSNSAMPLNAVSTERGLVTVHCRTSFAAELQGVRDPRSARGQLAAPMERRVNKPGPRLN